ncbi:conserved hypothetical protein [Ricinus communis]|uniref:Uncharacterized protein n=1 Tax=Ricinus communis TaxID=3988 RepID=B9RYT3_RICCO|nr:conserved hypothetical protein [Ricinus communis]
MDLETSLVGWNYSGHFLRQLGVSRFWAVIGRFFCFANGYYGCPQMRVRTQISSLEIQRKMMELHGQGSWLQSYLEQSTVIHIYKRKTVV